METILKLPIELYKTWLSGCQAGNHEYVLLKNGFIQHDADGRDHVHIPCDSAEAKALKELAAHLYPEVVPHIEDITLRDL